MRILLITLIILIPTNLYHHIPGIPSTMGERVGTKYYTQYWEARLYHGDYGVWEDKGTLWFKRGNNIIEFKR
ncbi:hypothetical protein K9N50_11380 [bacterium]|nr:hypothetical protein [bacterium]